ncbi:MAG: flap endonuclease [Lachnospiraceae bacterium]|nr:flap endonuclease [Lachnospiraceae bacterium]
MQKNKFLIVDGHNLLFQMFYGMPCRILNKEGKAIHGTLGFVGALIKLIKQTEPTHLVVLFDGEHENERSQVLTEYKANRPDFSKVPVEDNPFTQLPDVYKALDYMGIKHTEIADGETDDAIASYVYAYEGVADMIIASWDSDFFQMISPKVKVLRYRGKSSVLCDEAFVQEKFGIVPGQYADFKALVGDKADNIKGVDKVGVKTAAALLQEFGSLEKLLADPERIKKKAVRESVHNSLGQIQVNYQLIKLGNHAARPFRLEELLYQYDGQTTMQVLEGIGVR